MDGIHEAALKGDATLLAKLLESGDPNDIDIEMRSPLHCAIVGGSAECVSVLLAQKNIDLETRDICGYTPLHFAGTCIFPHFFPGLNHGFPDLRRSFAYTCLF
jgi:ankyrin repeat protein